MKYSFFSPSTQFENLGDTLINKVLCEQIARRSILWLDLSRSPPEFAQGLGLHEKEKNVKIFRQGTVLFLLKLIFTSLSNRDECYYYLSPGGYFGEIESGGWLSKKLRTSILHCLNLAGVKIVLVGVSYERLGPNYCDELSYRSKLYSYHYVRDQISFDYARSKGIQVSGCLPDLAYALYDGEKSIKSCSHRKKVYFSFRVDQYLEQYDDVCRLARYANNTIDGDYIFVFYAQVMRDRSSMKMLASELSSRGRRVQVDFPESLESAVNTFNTDCIVISNRLHVLLVAGAKGSVILPFLSKTYNRKLEGIFAEIPKFKTYKLDEQFNEMNLLSEGDQIYRFGKNQLEFLNKSFDSIYGLS